MGDIAENVDVPQRNVVTVDLMELLMCDGR